MASLADIVLDVAQTDDEYDPSGVVSIIEFVESDWGLGCRLYPAQRVILKANYGLALDDNPHGYDLSQPVPKDHPNYDPDLLDARGLYKLRVPLSDWRRENWQVMSEAGYLRHLYKEGRCNIKEVIPGQERREMVLAIGRRSGKTFLSACIAAYENYKLLKKKYPHKYYGISVSNPIQIISVATDKDQAALLYNDVSGFFKRCKFFEAFTANNTLTYARFQTPGDIEDTCRYAEDKTAAKVSIKVTFRSCIAKGLRGAGNMVIILDELAHFTDNKSQSSADKVYKAISPSKSAFSPKDEYGMPIGDTESRIISISSPLGKQGKFYELFQFGMKGGEGAEQFLCIQAPTWEINLGVPASELKTEYAKGSNSFFTEFGAEFTDRTRGWIEHDTDLIACVHPNRRPAALAPPRKPHFMGLDFAMVGDGTGVAIGHIEAINGINYVVADLVDYKIAGEGEYEGVDRLDHDHVADWIRDLCKRFFIVDGMFDQWAGPILEQCLHKRGLTQLKTHKLMAAQSSQIFQNFKDLMMEKRIILYDWPIPEDLEGDKKHCPYIAELLTLQATRVSKNIITVEAPTTAGCHDDMSDALVRMAWLATKSMGNQAYITRPGGGPAGGRKGAPATARIRAARRARLSGSHHSRQIPRGRRRF
jgi:hypothetical protein